MPRIIYLFLHLLNLGLQFWVVQVSLHFLQTETEDSIEFSSGAVMKAHLAHLMLFYRSN